MTNTSSATRRIVPAITLAFALLLAACGSDETVVAEAGSDTQDTPAATTSTSEADTPDPTLTGGPDFDPRATEPPPVIVSRGDASLELEAWTYCWTPPEGEDGICADGSPPTDVPLLGGDGPIEVVFPGDFSFSVVAYDESYTARIDGAAVSPVDGVWVVDPGPEGPTVFEVFGKGPEGDVIVTFAIG